MPNVKYAPKSSQKKGLVFVPKNKKMKWKKSKYVA